MLTLLVLCPEYELNLSTPQCLLAEQPKLAFYVKLYTPITRHWNNICRFMSSTVFTFNETFQSFFFAKIFADFPTAIMSVNCRIFMRSVVVWFHVHNHVAVTQLIIINSKQSQSAPCANYKVRRKFASFLPALYNEYYKSVLSYSQCVER